MNRMIKTLFAAVILISLSGCALLDSYFMASYDTIEHMLVNRINVEAALTKKQCNNPVYVKRSSESLNFSAHELENFSKNLPDNNASAKLNSLLLGMVEDLYKRYQNDDPVSKTYCELKLQSISDAASTIQSAIAKRHR